MLGVVAAALGAASVASASLPVFGGILFFPDIHQTSDPEEYAWEVKLGEGQELKAVDEQNAVVYYEDGHKAFSIAAPPAHDANGTAVPTTLAIEGENVITLTVHHRAGDPAAGGAPFDYPVTPGPSFEVGYSTVTVTIVLPPDEQQQREEREKRQREEWEAALRQEAREGCHVPPLHGQSLKASRERLKNAGCRLGKVRGERTRSARVVKQDFAVGQVKPTGTRVSVKLG